MKLTYQYVATYADTIYVQAFEDRMDLLRTVMVGARGTPYHNGLFFFDMQLPPSYPAEPPQVYYHSFGLRLNPNLYECGRVCLSLLNTFGGEGTEVWSPGMSSLLQIVCLPTSSGSQRPALLQRSWL
jgi:ubiquitin-conjugating enzyme E2 O